MNDASDGTADDIVKECYRLDRVRATNIKMNEGWICPRCGKVSAPDVKACNCKESDKCNDEELKQLDVIEEIKKYFDNPKDIPKQPEPINVSYYPYYPDRTYRPPYWFDWYTIC